MSTRGSSMKKYERGVGELSLGRRSCVWWREGPLELDCLKLERRRELKEEEEESRRVQNLEAWSRRR